MKQVSIKAANAIANAGYFGKYYRKCSVQEIVDSNRLVLNRDNSLESNRVPFYLEVWLWLWREKRIPLELLRSTEKDVWYVLYDGGYEMPRKDDPEEAIIAAIEYLVDNDLIK